MTLIEFKLLAVLAQPPGQLFIRNPLIDHMDGSVLGRFDRSIGLHIKNIRRKIEAEPGQPRFVETLYGEGYRFTNLE